MSSRDESLSVNTSASPSKIVRERRGLIPTVIVSADDHNDNGSSSDYEKRSIDILKESPSKNLRNDDCSGYSTSSENSDYEIVRRTDTLRNINNNNNKTSPRVRKRRPVRKINEDNVIVSNESTTQTALVNERQALVPVEADENEDTAGGGTSDEFWKTGEIRSNAFDCDNNKDGNKRNKKTKKRTDSPLSNVRSRFARFGTVLNDWKEFAKENETDLRILRLNRNRCLLQSFVLFVFCGVGAIVFRTTEGAFEVFYKCGVKRVKRDFLDTLWDRRYLPEEEWKSLARSKLMSFENQLYDAYEAGMTSYSGQKGWSFFNSIVYVLTVVTTIGYGHLAPTTHFGRIATIVYSLFGIPMFLILLADYGKLFTRSIKFVWAFVRRLYYTGSCRKVRRTAPVQEVMKGMQMMYGMTRRQSKDQATVVESSIADVQIPPGTASPTCTPALSSYTIDDQFNLPISVAFVILLVYMIAGAGFFSYTENWEFLDAFYFVYISMSTIGFGDLVPKSQMTTMMVTLVYFVFGLALTSMCINVIQEKLSNSFKQATAKIGATIGFEVENDAVVVQFENPEQQLQLDIVVPSNEQYEEQT